MTDMTSPHEKRFRSWFFAFFLVSGFCSLIYEVVWMRLAMASFGVNTAMVSIVVAMFMAGLGAGSWIAGAAARRRMSAAASLRFYALVELLIGISSIAVPLELTAGREILLHSSSWQSSLYFLQAGVWIAITLIPWCACMGATFPLLMSVFRHSQFDSSKDSFSFLYVANVVGALLGTLGSAFVLIEILGFHGTLHTAGAMNAALALTALLLSRQMPAGADAAVETAAEQTQTTGANQWALVFLFCTGMVSMGVEVVWIRQYTPYLGNAVYAFASILGVYLLATAMGSRDYRKWSRTHSAVEAAPAWALLAFAAVLPLIAVDPLLRIGQYDFPGLFRLVLIMPFCALAGFLTPMLIDSWSGGDPNRAGRAYAFNVAGCIVGPLIASFCLLPYLSEKWTTICLAAPLFAIAAAAGLRSAPGLTAQVRKSTLLRLSLAGAAAILVATFSHGFESKYPDHIVMRDSTATVMAFGSGMERHLLVNGIGMTVLTPATKYIAHLPLAAMDRPPQNGLVVCFGMGTSFRSMLSWDIPTTVVELVPSVPKLFGYYHSDADQLMRSPLAHVHIDDGRRFLDGSPEMYDVIVFDPPPPVAAAGSSLLYSRELYTVVKRHLRAGGILQMWYPKADGEPTSTAAVTRALMESFPYVRAYWSFEGGFGIHFLASMSPIPELNSATLAARMPAAAQRDLLEWGPETDVRRQLDLVLGREINLQTLIALNPRVPAISDDQPINEYYVLREKLGYYR